MNRYCIVAIGNNMCWAKDCGRKMVFWITEMWDEHWFSSQLGGAHADRGVGHTIALPWPNPTMGSSCAAVFSLEIMAEVVEEA